jgi:cell division protease FtsH
MMVEAMGMSDIIGPRNIGGAGASGSMGPYNRNMSGMGGEGSELKAKVDGEIDRILREQYDRGMHILTENRNILDAIAKRLIEKEKISGTELLELI